jgi:hypothetical protein
MNKKSNLAALLLLSLLMVNMIFFVYSVSAQAPPSGLIYREQFHLERGSIRYYVTSLDENETWTINCTSIYQGVFYLFMFELRPKQEYIDRNAGNISDLIFSEAIAYNSTPILINSSVDPEMQVHFLVLEKKVTEKKLYYLGVAIVNNPPDTYLLFSNHEIQPYFIPFIPGYPLEWIGLCSLFIIGIFYKKYRNQRKKS